MSEPTWLYIFAVVFAALVVLAPYILRVRINFLRFFRWRWFADWHERHFKGIVLGVRVVLSALAITLVVLGLTR